MPLYVSPSRSLRILFIHIPKCGGGSIEKFFRDQGFTQYLFSIEPSLISVLRCSPQHMHAAILNELIVMKDIDYCFTVIRNPIDRMVSEYRHRIFHPWCIEGFDSWYLKAFKLYTNNPYCFDNHMRHQSDFLTSNARVFWFEDGLENTLEAIGSELKLDWDTSKLVNQKRGKRLSQLSDDPKLKDLYVNAKPSIMIENRIRKDYSLDFDLFSRHA